MRLFSPAKINLFLAITGRRPDGYHDLVSLAVPLAFGDELEARRLGRPGTATLTCDFPELPVDASNLVLRAAELFREATGWSEAVAFHLVKRTPLGAGLGGGSSNAVAALRILNTVSGAGLSRETLGELAARLGSDCRLFLEEAPVLLRGRGERVERAPDSAAGRLRGRRVLLFKPSFSISTVWAYQTVAKTGRHYLPLDEAERRLASWLAGEAPAEALLFNNLEPVAFEKFLALPTLLTRLRERHGAAVAMSGSGSACFALLSETTDSDALRAEIREAWGEAVFLVETTLA